MVTLESAVLSAWYGSRPVIGRLFAVGDREGLRVLVHVERAFDSNEIHQALIANRDVWIEELKLSMGRRVRREHSEEQFGDEVFTEASGVVVAALSWRDPSFT